MGHNQGGKTAEVSRRSKYVFQSFQAWVAHSRSMRHSIGKKNNGKKGVEETLVKTTALYVRLSRYLQVEGPLVHLLYALLTRAGSALAHFQRRALGNISHVQDPCLLLFMCLKRSQLNLLALHESYSCAFFNIVAYLWCFGSF